MHRKGLGVRQDSAGAAKWLRKSADLGLASAQTNIGAMYALGEGVPQSRAEAIKWTRLAADQGDALAQYNLGLMYCDATAIRKISSRRICGSISRPRRA